MALTSSLQERFRNPEILVAPGAYDAFTARLIEDAGFEAVYLSGAGIAYTSMATPDLGLITMTEMVERVTNVCRAIELPLIVDGDTGYGNATNVIRTVESYESAGAAAIQLEDQQFPKRCGHLAGKELVPAEDMVGKIRAACAARTSSDFLIIARTDAASVLGLDAAIERGQRYLEAGADVLFVESPASADELQAVAEAFPNTWLMANMVEGGRTPLFSASELEAMGYSLVIFPNTLTRRFAYEGQKLLANLLAAGTSASQLDRMFSFNELNHLMRIEHFEQQERKYLPSPDG